MTEENNQVLPPGVASRLWQGIEYLNLTNAGVYMGYSKVGLQDLIKELREAEEAGAKNPLPTWNLGGNKRDKWIKRSDLDSFMTPKRAE